MGNLSKDIYDPDFVKGVFDRCSEKYITFSYIFSMGFTERWRKSCVKLLQNLPENAVGLDLMAGTGEVWPHLLEQFPHIKEITAVDISSGMHEKALIRLHAIRAHKISFIEDNVFNSKLSDDSADFIIVTFGLKTFNTEQQAQLAKLVSQKLKPGGVFSMIEASDPKGWILRPLYLFHLKYLLPIVELIFLRGATDFKMIGTYSTNFGDSSGIAEQMKNEGLDVKFKKHFFGCASSVSGRKLLK